jgi:hypothetical protein
MAMGSSVPPRAYTRETLTTAFNWLQSQPESVRSKATTPDALVGLYMQATSRGALAAGFDAEAPQSSQAFMSDLKNLAEGLKEFDDSRGARAVNPPASSRAQLGNQQKYPQEPRPSYPQSTPPPIAKPAPKPSAPAESVSFQERFSDPNLEPEMTSFETDAPTAESAPHAPSENAFGPSASSSAIASGLNERSLSMLREVQFALNLTSETETMNMMIALAHKSLKSLLA